MDRADTCVFRKAAGHPEPVMGRNRPALEPAGRAEVERCTTNKSLEWSSNDIRRRGRITKAGNERRPLFQTGCSILRRRHSALAAALLAVGAFLLIGCAPRVLQPPGVVMLSEDVRRQLGPIKVVAGDGSPSVHVTEAAKGVFGGMGRGALVGAVAVTLGDPRGLILSPVGAIVGAVVGAIAADPTSKVEADEQTLRTIVPVAKMSEALCGAVARIALDAAVPIAEANADTDVILEIAVGDFRFVGNEWSINPDLALLIRIESRLRGAAAPAAVPHVVVWHSVPRERKTWVADDAGALQEELARATDALAHRIVEDLFLVLATPEAPR